MRTQPGSTQDLYDLERKLLDAVQREYTRYEESDSPIPLTLVKLMIDAHAVVSKRIASGQGRAIDGPVTTAALRSLAIELQQELSEVQMMIQQNECLS